MSFDGVVDECRCVNSALNVGPSSLICGRSDMTSCSVLGTLHAWTFYFLARILVLMLNLSGGVAKFFAEVAPQSWGRIQLTKGEKNTCLMGLTTGELAFFFCFFLDVARASCSNGFAFNSCLTFVININNPIFPDLIEDSFAQVTCYFRGATHFAMIHQFLLLFSVIAESTCKSIVGR
jgi:hypothetical protein